MAWYTGITDFFRGAFGEDDEEKKRRKQREAQQAAQRKPVQRPPKPQLPQQVRQFTEPQDRQLDQPKKLFQQQPPAPKVEDTRSFWQKISDQITPGDAKTFKNPTPEPNKRAATETLGDFFRPNSPQDMAKRRAAGQPERYEDQVKDNVLRRNINTPASVVRTIAQETAKLPANLAVTLTDKAARNASTARIQTLNRLKGMSYEERKNLINQARLDPSNGLPIILEAVGVDLNDPSDMKLDQAILQASYKPETYTPGSRLEKMAFGDAPIEGYTQRSEGVEKETGIPAPVIGLLTMASDFPGVGKGKKVAEEGLERVAKATDDKLPAFLRRAFRGNADETAEKAVGKEVAEAVEDTAARQDELRRVIDDPNEIALTRKNAAEELKKLEEAAIPKDPLDRPAFLHRADIERVIKEEEDKLTDYVARHPELDRQQLEAVREAAKQRTLKLVDELRASRTATVKAVDDEAAAIQNAAEAQAKANEQVIAEQAARSTPPASAVGGGGATPPPRSPEAAANDAAYRSDTDVLFEDAPKFEEKGRLSASQLLSPDRYISKYITRPAVNAVDRGIARMQTARNPIARFFGRLPVGVSREAGTTPELLAQKRLLRGGFETGKLYRETIADLGKNMDNNAKLRVWSTLDPQQAQKLGLPPVRPEELSPVEAVYRDKLDDIINFTTQENLKRGLITPEQAANDDYIKRGYSIFEGTDLGKAYNESRAGLLSQFKGRGEVDEKLLEKAITDPGYLVAKKSAESHAAWAMVDYGNYLDESGLAVDAARPSYAQLPNNKLFGNAAGKWVPNAVNEDFVGFQYSTGMANAFNDLVTAYDSIGLRKLKKQLLTVFNPAVRAGNQFSNRVVFSNMNGINPVQFNKVYAQVRNMEKEGHQLYREAVEQGLTGIDITQADFARRLSEYVDDPNLGKKSIEWFQNSYSKADDRARIAAYAIHRSRGYSPTQAAEMVQRGFQDYNSVGFFYDLAAKTPLIGNAFVRFAGDAIRIAKNAAVDHPLRSAATIALWASFVNAMSRASGESAEDKATREGRFGAPKIPFTDISLTVQTPYGELNVARFLPFYALNDVGNEAMRFLPIQQSPVTRDEQGDLALSGGGFQDPLLGQFMQAFIDKDFRNKSIQDPDDVEFADGTSKYQFDQLPDEQRRNNLLRFFFTQNAPLGREIDSVKSALQGKEDIYGKTRSPIQALFRAGGVKVEQFGKEQAQDTREREAYFDRLEQIEAEAAKLSPAAQAAYRRLTGQYKLRDQKENPFEPGTTIDKKAPVYDFSENKWGEYMQNPELFDLMEMRAREETKADPKKPLHPFFDERLPKDFRLQLIQQRSIAPGDDLELYQRLTNDPRWDYYQRINDEYKAKGKKYYPDSGDKNGDFTDEMVKHQDADFPKKPPIWEQYIAAREKGIKPAWNDELEKARNQYENDKLNWTNKERAARGLPPIPAEQWFNETFGYTPEEDNGYGGGGYNPADHIDTLGRLTNFSNDVSRLDPIEAAAMPELAQLFTRLRAGSGGGRRKPRLGASASGR